MNAFTAQPRWSRRCCWQAVAIRPILKGHVRRPASARTRVTLPPPGITPAVSSQQLLTGTFNGQTQSLLVMLNADDHKVTLAGLSSVGIRLFTATYDDTGIHTEQSIVVPQLPPASRTGRCDAQPLATQRPAATTAKGLDA